MQHLPSGLVHNPWCVCCTAEATTGRWPERSSSPVRSNQTNCRLSSPVQFNQTVFTNLLHCVRINGYTSNRLFHLSIKQLGCQICGPPDITQDTTTTGGFQFHTSQTWGRAAGGVPTTAGGLLRPPRDLFVAHLSASHFLDEQRNWTNIPKTHTPVVAVSCLFLQTIMEHQDGKSGGIETRAKVQKHGKTEFAVRCLASWVTQSPSDTVLNWSQTWRRDARCGKPVTSLFALKYKKSRFPSIWLLIIETDTDLSSFQFACTVRHDWIWWLTTAKNNHCPRCHCPDRRLSATLCCSELHTNGPKQRTLGAHEATRGFFPAVNGATLFFGHTLWLHVCPCNKGLPTHGRFHVGRAINSPLTGRNNAPSLKDSVYLL